MQTELSSLFYRDLDRLTNEINAYEDESTIWETHKYVNNSAGSLSLHLCGNLQHFVGHLIGGSAYQRDREFEFNAQVSRAHLLNEIEAAKRAVKLGFEQVDWSAEFPVQVLKRVWTNGEFLLHLYGHLNYHLGQISYHRRLLDE